MPKMIADEFSRLHISPQKRKRLRWKRDGRCVTCGKPARPDAYYCPKHTARFSQHNAKRDRRQQK